MSTPTPTLPIALHYTAGPRWSKLETPLASGLGPNTSLGGPTRSRKPAIESTPQIFRKVRSADNTFHRLFNDVPYSKLAGGEVYYKAVRLVVAENPPDSLEDLTIDEATLTLTQPSTGSVALWVDTVGTQSVADDETEPSGATWTTSATVDISEGAEVQVWLRLTISSSTSPSSFESFSLVASDATAVYGSRTWNFTHHLLSNTVTLSTLSTSAGDNVIRPGEVVTFTVAASAVLPEDTLWVYCAEQALLDVCTPDGAGNYTYPWEAPAPGAYHLRFFFGEGYLIKWVHVA